MPVVGATAAAREVLAWGPEHGLDVTYVPEDASPSSDRALLARLDSLQPDIVHLHCFYQDFDYDLLPQLCARHKIVFTLHDVYTINQYGPECWECYRNPYCLGCPALGPIRRWRPNYRTRDRWRKRQVNRRSPCHLIYPSAWMRKRLAKSEWSAHPGTVIPYGIDTDRFSPGPPRRRAFGLPDETPVVLFAGNMYSEHDHRKGLPELLLAFEAVRLLHPNATLALAGDIRGLQDQRGVQHLGNVDEDRLPDLYRSADLFVLPTRGDNLPIAVLEAASSGLPTVATRVGGLPEQVLDDVTGHLVQPDDHHELADAIALCLSDPNKLRQMGQSARAHAVRTFAREVSARSHLDLYRQL